MNHDFAHSRARPLPRRRTHVARLTIAILASLALARAGSAQAGSPAPPPAAAPIAEDGPAYEIGRFNLKYLHGGHPGHPSRDELMQLEIQLGRTPQGYVAPRDSVPPATLRLADVEDRPPERYHASALQSILVRLHTHIADQGLIGLFIAPDPEQISQTGVDLRPEGRTNLRIVITTALVAELHTQASGDRIAPEERIDHPLHAPIVDRSPLRPTQEGEKKRKDLLHKETLDDFLFRLGRHPGRRVDAALSPGELPGTVILDYLVTEQRPLAAYAQLSNTGTRSTDRLRERFGITHSQLTNNDDVLAIDYVTASFDDVNAVIASYEAPFPGVESMRWRVFGNWSEYTATQLGFFNDIFRGDSWTLGAEVIANIHQRRNLFVDLVAGARFEHISVDNEAVGVAGEEDFSFLRLGLRFERQTRRYSVTGSLMAEWNDGIGKTPDRDQLNRLGRLFPDPHFGVLRWDLRAAAYLEPLLDRAAWDDPATPGSSTLAHEVALSFRGQYAFDNRLVPQFEQVLGGFSSVRGYPESVIAGDTVLVGSLEYRYHVPRALDIEPTPAELFGEPFRIAPQNVYGRPDWDLVLRAFVDVGHTFVNDALFFENEELLIGTGVGAELVLRRDLLVRVDWGFALEGLEGGRANAGSNRLHFVASFFF